MRNRVAPQHQEDIEAGSTADFRAPPAVVSMFVSTPIENCIRAIYARHPQFATTRSS